MLFQPSFWVDIMLPVPVQAVFTYAWHEERQPQLGLRVHVPFGRQRCVMGVVAGVRTTPPEGLNAKPVTRILDDEPRILPRQIEQWQWMASYYMCAPGQVMMAALPSFFKLEEGDEGPFKIGDGRVAHYQWSQNRDDEGAISKAFESLYRAPKQSELLLAYFQLATDWDTGEDAYYPWVPQQSILDSSDGASALKALVDKGFLTKELRVPEVMHRNETTLGARPDLSDSQKVALNGLEQGLDDGKPVLLRGVTGAGKTELYLHLMHTALDAGQHVLMMVPEIALTVQLQRRIAAALGPERVHVYHSQTGEAARRDLWEQLRDPKSAPSVVLGARSAIFLPFAKLGLIVIDEEHESSFKQAEPAPRYHARDCALWMARQLDAGVVMGSATPSVESYHRALEGKYHLVSLERRYGGVPLPEIEILNQAKYAATHRMEGPLTKPAFDAVVSTLESQQQGLIFRNRRGYASSLQCQACGHTTYCEDCDVAMTYHKRDQYLRCHYCGAGHPTPSHCHNCNQRAWAHVGTGTERIEEDVSALFPEARVLRIDSDSTRQRKALSQYVAWLESGEVDLVVGTQMVGKGLDVSGMSLAVVLDADVLLQWPDFRAFERAFQMLVQVAGRTGRREKQGKVLIQSYHVQHPVLDYVTRQDYEGMAQHVLADRKVHHYPPFVRLVKLELRHRNAMRVRQAAVVLAEALRERLGGGILGPDAPHIARLRNQYLQQIWVKLQPNEGLAASKRIIKSTVQGLTSQVDYSSVRVIVDVDPM